MPLMAHIDHPPPSLRGGARHAAARATCSPTLPALPERAVTARARSSRRCWRRASAACSSTSATARARSPSRPRAPCWPTASMPDTISSDVHTLCIDGPAFDQVTTLSKFLCLGMPLTDVIAASTVNAAMALKRPELGTLKPGSGRRRHHPLDRGRPVRLRRRHRRAPDRRPQDRVRRRRPRRPLVAPETVEKFRQLAP